MIQQLLHSLIFRPYVTLFLLAFLALSWREQGAARTAAWLVSGYLVAFAAEWGSINHGVPFGWYVYHYDALAQDLVVFGVPFFDSVSFPFLSYVSFSFAQFLLSPLQGLRRLTPPSLRNSTAVLALGALLMVVIDVVIDPLALLGKYWFLGEIYHYPEPGPHFGVPLANYAGWLVVALATIAVNQRLDSCLPGQAPVACNGWFAPGLWAVIVLIHIGITYWLAFGGAGLDSGRVLRQACAGTATVVPFLAWAAVKLLKSGRQVR